MLLRSAGAVVNIRFGSKFAASALTCPQNRERCLKCMHASPAMGLRPNKPVGKRRYAAVLVPVCIDDEEHSSILYTRRSALLSRHVRQISFPGGLRDAEDLTYEECALRETEEEIGLPRARVQLWGSGPMLHPPHTASVMPVYGIIKDLKMSELTLNKQEVDEAFVISIDKLASPEAFFHTQFKDGFSAPCFIVGPYRIWGLTAFLTYNFLQCLLPSWSGDEKPKIEYIQPFKVKKSTK